MKKRENGGSCKPEILMRLTRDGGSDIRFKYAAIPEAGKSGLLRFRTWQMAAGCAVLHFHEILPDHESIKLSQTIESSQAHQPTISPRQANQTTKFS